MKKYILLCIVFYGAHCLAQGNPELTEQWRPEIKVVEPGKTSNAAPADAIVLFDSVNLDNWISVNDKKAAKWKVEHNIFTVAGGTGNIQTKQKFGDCQLHIEWRTPAEVKGTGQGRGNSGIFFMGLYELQVLDNYENRTYSNGQAGSIYKQLPPLVNVCRKPGEWQTYDVIFTAPRYNKDSTIKTQARITVLQNGVLVQNNATIWGATKYIGIATNEVQDEKASLILQDHGNPVSYRNVWIREL
ncbi:MAG: DUF1080 domain-containing protein [Niabella sp.]